MLAYLIPVPRRTKDRLNYLRSSILSTQPKTKVHLGSKVDKGAFTNDVSREGEGGGYPNSDAVREVA